MPIDMDMQTDGYYVYMMASTSNNHLYVGVTNNLVRRVWEHKSEIFKGYTHQNHLHRLVYYQRFWSIEDAIAREKQLKRWSRVKKEILIERANPARMDLGERINVEKKHTTVAQKQNAKQTSS